MSVSQVNQSMCCELVVRLARWLWPCGSALWPLERGAQGPASQHTVQLLPVASKVCDITITKKLT